VPLPSRLRTRAALLAPFAALVLTACGGNAAGETDAPAASAEGATIAHSFGRTTVPAAPTRVVTWGWGSADAAVALGVVPVAMPHQSYGGDEQGVLPWLRERLEADGADVPTVLPDQQEVPIEAIAAAQPDLVLAPYSGITQEEYAQLSRIAPTVAPPGEPWATPWRETVEIVGQALGRSDQAETLLADIDASVAEQAAQHPQLEGKTVAMVWDSAGTFYVYEPADARVQFVLDLGMVSAPSVAELSTGESTFYSTLSYERTAELSSDILLSFASTREEADAFAAQPYAQTMAQVTSGHHATLVGDELIAAVSPPTVLSLTWGLDDYLPALSAAA